MKADKQHSSRLSRWNIRAEIVEKALVPLGGKAALLDAAESLIPDLPRGHRSCCLNFKGQLFDVSFNGLCGRSAPVEIFVHLDGHPGFVFAYRARRA